MDRMDEHYPSLRGGRVIVTGGASDFGESIVELCTAQNSVVDAGWV